MKSNTIQRLLIVVAVTLASLYLIYPTMRYFLGVGDTPVVATSEERLAELKTESVPLGLDLQGGVDVLLAVDTEKTEAAKVTDIAERIRRNFSAESPSIEGSVEVSSGTQEVIVQVNRQDQVRAADNTLTEMSETMQFFEYDSGSLQANVPVRLKINNELLRQDMQQTVESSIKVIRDRVDSLGVTQPTIVQQGNDRIRVQIPGEKDPQRAIDTMIRPAKLEFRGVHTSDQSIPGSDGEPVYPENSSEFIDITTGKVLEGKRIPPGYEVLPYRQTSRATAEGQPAEESTRYILAKKQAELTGAALKDAHVNVAQGGLNAGEVEVIVQFNDAGSEEFGEITEKYHRKPLAIVLDGVVYSAPNINEPIKQGYCSITGGFALEEARDLSLVLKAGALPAELITMDMRTVEATLGADSISKSVFALGLGSLIIGVYMIAYYGAAGIIAVIAVLINVILIFAFMKLANATLTLSGIGGILLTVGMAVDANVLIYERIREELREGKNMKQAIQLGFGKAFSVIFDANLTTLICGLVLLQFGEGSIKGFALSLNVGILATLFTGLFVTKTLIDVWYEKLGNINFGKLAWFQHAIQVDFLKVRKLAYSVSIAFCAFCLGYVLVNGSNWGVDFEGGLLSEVSANKEMTTQQVEGKYEGWRVQKVAGENQFLVRMKLDEEKQTLADAKSELSRRLDETIGSGQYSVLSSEAVSNEVGREFTNKAILACIVASIGILIYLAFRFEFVFGVAAVIALFHDLIIAYGLFNLLGDFKLAGEVTLDVVAALLVVLGYSVNDTIIIFDRIRENRKLHPTMPDYQLINLSISESLNRTIMTVSTVVIVLVTMLLVGGAGLFDFALVLLIGIVMGTYSSLYVASPLVFLMHERARKKGKAITYRTSGEQEVQPMLKNR